MGIAENIKKRRLELNLSQQELANSLGYKSRSTIAKIEAGENEVPFSKLPKFARALDTSVNYLKTGIEEKQTSFPINRESSGSPRKRIVIVLAGGKSTRNLQNIPNQFINVLGKPVIIYCLEAYQRHPAIDAIYVVCLKDWKEILNAYASQYGISKLKGIIQAGDTGIKSVRNGFEAIRNQYDANDIIIFQESTRPLVTEEMISKVLNACQQNGSAVTCAPMGDYLQFQLSNDIIEASHHYEYLNRYRIVSAESPEAYSLETVSAAFKLADQKKHAFNESCFVMLLNNLGLDLYFIEGAQNNIKVIRQEDISILSALLKNRM